MDLTTVAYATFALSLFVSAIKVGGWILNADPHAIINAGRWSLLALAALAIAALLWFMANERWPSAMLLMAFMLPIFVQALPRWRLLLNVRSSGFPPVIETMDPRALRKFFPKSHAPGSRTGAPVHYRAAGLSGARERADRAPPA